jgi:hypothetical protein
MALADQEFKLKSRYSQVPVAHTCNPSYSRGRDQEDPGSKSTWANSSWDSVSKKKKKDPSQKKGWQSGSRCRPWVQTPVPKKKREWENKKRDMIPVDGSMHNLPALISVKKKTGVCLVVYFIILHRGWIKSGIRKDGSTKQSQLCCVCSFLSY